MKAIIFLFILTFALSASAMDTGHQLNCRDTATGNKMVALVFASDYSTLTYYNSNLGVHLPYRFLGHQNDTMVYAHSEGNQVPTIAVSETAPEFGKLVTIDNFSYACYLFP